MNLWIGVVTQTLARDQVGGKAKRKHVTQAHQANNVGSTAKINCNDSSLLQVELASVESFVPSMILQMPQSPMCHLRQILGYCCCWSNKQTCTRQCNWRFKNWLLQWLTNKCIAQETVDLVNHLNSSTGLLFMELLLQIVWNRL